MKRLLVFGFAPLPFENEKKNFGPGIRAWQFIQPLTCEIRFVACRIPFIYNASIPDVRISKSDQFTYYNLSEKEFRNSQRIQDIHDDFQPDAILAATIFATSPLPALKTTQPIWIDLFGHVMAEAQAKMHRYHDNSYLLHFLEHEIRALQRGDVFSTVSNAQSHATTGELGLIGRLTAETTGYSFCHTIPCAIDPAPLRHLTRRIRGIEVPDDAFIVLWSGGYNTWTDTATLIQGLESAMREVPNLYYVSTGGSIDGHDEITYAEFQKRVETSVFRKRFILKGWLPKEQVGDYYFEANLGINIDHFMHEGLYGSKNRVMDWMRAGLPALMGELCELSHTLPSKGYAFSFPLHNPTALAASLIDLATHPDKIQSASKRIKQYALEEFSFHTTTLPFQKWLQNPTCAPDKSLPNPGESPVVVTTRSYLDSIQCELENRQNHIRELEKYIRHIEQEHRKNNPTQSDNPDQALLSSKSGPDLLIESINPSVSIVIVTWNGIDYLKPCIDSIRDQRYQQIEVIIIDNASSDGSDKLIESEFPFIRFYRNSKNLGFSRGVNQGIHYASGDIIILLNQDTVMLSGCIDALVQELTSHNRVAIVGSKILDPDRYHIQHAGGIVRANGLTNHIGSGEVDNGQYDENHDCDYVTGACLAFKRTLINQIGVLDERFSPAYFEELDYCLRAIRSGYRVRYVAASKLIHHESTSTGKLSSRFYNLYHRNRLKFILKHNTCRYLYGIFRRTELSWIRQSLPKEQLIPLLNAYFHCIPMFTWVCIRDLIRRSR